VALALTHEKCAEHAAAVERVVLPEETSVFTVKPPRTLVARVPARARESGTTISALVAQALTKYLASGKAEASAPTNDRVVATETRSIGARTGICQRSQRHCSESARRFR
jgi:hypothetical protein